MGGHHPGDPVADRVRRLEAALVAAGLLEPADVDAALAAHHAVQGTVVNGARLVVRAWLDEAFKDLLLRDGNAAVAAEGITWVGEEPIFRVVANTPRVHHVVVCTLCSCYPIGLLGPSPHWYRSLEYRARVVREPRVVLAELGLALDEDVEVVVHDASAETRYMVLPLPPEGVEGRAESDLLGMVTQPGLIGTAVR